MKKILTFAFAALALVAFTACNDSDDTAISYPTDNPYIENGMFEGDNMHFYGKLQSTSAAGEVFATDGVHFEFAGGTDGKAVLYMHATQFAAAMPGIEMRLKHIEYTGEGKKLTFSTESIVPEANLSGNLGDYKPFDRFTISNFAGTVDNISCKINFSCIGYIVNFEGRLAIEK